MPIRLRTDRHSRLPARAGALVVGAALGGCSSLQLPTRLDIPANGADFRTRVYAGATMGNSHLTPDTRGTVFNVDGRDDLGTQIKLGVDVHNMLAVELDTSVLGTATLREAATDVNYSAATVSALVYGLNGVQLRSRREGWSAYGRFGLGVLKKSSAVVALEESGAHPVIGAGAEYGFDNGLGVRGEITRFDDDAYYFGLGAIYRFGLTPRQVGGLIAEIAEPVIASEDKPLAEGGRVLERGGRFASARDTAPPALQAAMPRTGDPSRPAADRDRDGVADASDRCPDTTRNVTVDRDGCGLFDTVLADVVFKSGSHWMTARARGELDRIVAKLLVFPEARVRVIAHTDAVGSADANLALSARRAEAVVQYLASGGVSELQLEPLGVGESRPLASNLDAAGRARNRRVELETLANLERSRIAGGAGRADPSEPVRWLPPVAATVPKRTAAPASAAAPAPAPGPVPLAPEPAVGAAVPPAAPADALAELLAGLPAPLPAPGIVPGLDIGGVIDGVGFLTGSDELLPTARPELARIAAELRAHPEARVAIMAHTDDQGREADNLALSEARAGSVLEHLVGLGVERSRLVPEGYGESLPVVQNLTAEDRARNRRVELRIIR